MKDMNDFIEVNKDIFDIEEHRIKMNVPPQAEFYGFTLVNRAFPKKCVTAYNPLTGE